MNQGATLKCKRCGSHQPTENFFSERLGGMAQTCRTCRTRMSEAAYHRTRTRSCEDRRREWMPKKYGMSYEQFLDRLALQDPRCAICGTESPGGKHDWWVVDHDHSNGAVRGILCNPCNVGLGSFRDSPFALKKAIEYLKASS